MQKKKKKNVQNKILFVRGVVFKKIDFEYVSLKTTRQTSKLDFFENEAYSIFYLLSRVEQPFVNYYNLFRRVWNRL